MPIVLHTLRASLTLSCMHGTKTGSGFSATERAWKPAMVLYLARRREGAAQSDIRYKAARVMHYTVNCFILSLLFDRWTGG